MAYTVRPGRWHGELRTGRLRPAKVGLQSHVSEVVVKTWTESGSSTRPKVGVQVKTTKDDDWNSVDQIGTYAIDTAAITGTGTLLSHTVAGTAVTGVGPYTINVNPRKVRIYEDTTKLEDWTHSGWDVTLDEAKSNGTELIIYWHGTPQQVGAVGDIMELSTTGRMAIITAATDHEAGTVEWGADTDVEAATLIPAQGIDAGQGELVFGVPYEVDDLEIRLIVAARENASATLTKLKELVVVGFQTGEERTGDET